MLFAKITSAIFDAIPEFKTYCAETNEDVDEEMPYMFLSGFGVFVRDAITGKKTYAVRSLSFINSFINENVDDEELMQMMVVGVLEILTDTAVTQKEASKNFTAHCYKFFDELLTGGYFRDLRQVNY